MTPQTGSSPAEGPSGSLGAAVRAVSQLKSAMLQQKPQMLLLHKGGAVPESEKRRAA